MFYLTTPLQAFRSYYQRIGSSPCVHSLQQLQEITIAVVSSLVLSTINMS